ncbi:hypothetical protein FNF31_03567 [Cafeteria roenbergensis]|uniref:Protein kinase domain-containing protein n=2 Tax=Cafeteria roenbergensis TaxID=33653 RepID=A0A5A8DD42_CAFRO|nr:hypothetical protein FNF31_03567 [Cafeteria roenbergensis]
MGRQTILTCPTWGSHMFVELYLGREHREPSAPKDATLSGSVFLGRLAWTSEAGGGVQRSGPILLKAFTSDSRLMTCIREASALARANGWPEREHVHYCGTTLEAASARARRRADACGPTSPLGAALAVDVLDEAFEAEGSRLGDRPHSFAPRMIAYSTHARLMEVDSDEAAMAAAARACEATPGLGRHGGRGYRKPPLSRCESVVVMQGLDTTLSRLIDPSSDSLAWTCLPESEFVRPFLGPSLLGALARCHSAGIAHLDVKPDNIGIHVCASRGTVRAVLIDFGLSFVFPLDEPAAAEEAARRAAAAELAGDDAGVVPPGVTDGQPHCVAAASLPTGCVLRYHKCGTMQYVPPEMFLASQRAERHHRVTQIDTRRADVFSAAASLAEAITGRRLPWADTHLLAVAFMPAVAELIPAPASGGPVAAKLVARRRAEELIRRARGLAGAWYNPAADAAPAGHASLQPEAVIRGNEAYARFCRDPACRHAIKPGASPTAFEPLPAFASAPADGEGAGSARGSGGPGAAPGAAASSPPHVFEDDREMQRLAEAAANPKAPLPVKTFDEVAQRVRARLAMLEPPTRLPAQSGAASPVLLPTFAEYITRPLRPGDDPSLGARADFFSFAMAFAGLEGRFLTDRALPRELLAHEYVAGAQRVLAAADGLPPTESADETVLHVIRARVGEMLVGKPSAATRARVESVVGKLAVAMAVPRAVGGPVDGPDEAAATAAPDATAYSAGEAPGDGAGELLAQEPALWDAKATMATGERVAAAVVRAARTMSGSNAALAVSVLSGARAARVGGGSVSAGAAGRSVALGHGAAVASLGKSSIPSSVGWSQAEAQAFVSVQGVPGFGDDQALLSIDGVAREPVDGPSSAVVQFAFPRSAGTELAAAADLSNGISTRGVQAVRRSGASLSQPPLARATESGGSTAGAGAAPARAEQSGLWATLSGAIAWMVAGPSGARPLPEMAESSSRTAATSPELEMLARLRHSAATAQKLGRTDGLESEARAQWAAAARRAIAAVEAREASAYGIVSRQLGLDPAQSRVAQAVRLAVAQANPEAVATRLANEVSLASFARERLAGRDALWTQGPGAALAVAAGAIELLRAPGGLIDAVGRLQAVSKASQELLGVAGAIVFSPVVSTISGGVSMRLTLAVLEEARNTSLGAVRVCFRGSKVESLPEGDEAVEEADESDACSAASAAGADGPASGAEEAPAAAAGGLAEDGVCALPERLPGGWAMGAVTGVPAWASARLLVIDVIATRHPCVGSSTVSVRRADSQPISRHAIELSAMADTLRSDQGAAGGALGFWGSPLHQQFSSADEQERGVAVVPVASDDAFQCVSAAVSAALAACD